VKTNAAPIALRCGIDGFDLPVDKARLMPMPTIVEKTLGRRVQAITLGRTILINPSIYAKVVAGEEPELLAHELVHVAQWEHHGITGFIALYARDYLRLRALGASHDAAYRSIGFEYQACSAAHNIKRSIQ